MVAGCTVQESAGALWAGTGLPGSPPVQEVVVNNLQFDCSLEEDTVRHWQLLWMSESCSEAAGSVGLCCVWPEDLCETGHGLNVTAYQTDL